jgi:hypothetical protein
MKLRRTKAGDAPTRVEVLAPQGWVTARIAVAQIPSLDQHIAEDVIALLALPPADRERLLVAARDVELAAEDGVAVLSFALVPRFHVV